MTCPTCDGAGEVPYHTLSPTVDGCTRGESWVPDVIPIPCPDCEPVPRVYPPDPVFGPFPEEEPPCQFPAA